MSAPRLTDALLEATLRAYVPSSAPAGLRQRIVEAAEETPQAMVMPGILARLTDPGRTRVDRRLLLAASLVVLLLAIVAAVAIGQQFRANRTPEELLERTWTSMEDPPAFEMDLRSDTGGIYRLQSDGEGQIRFGTTDDDPFERSDWYYVAAPGRIGRGDLSMQLWNEETRSGEPALAEVWLPATLEAWRAGGPATWPPSPDCAWEPATEVTIADRKAHALACPDLRLTVDDETGLPLASTWIDESGAETTLRATALRLGAQPEDLFAFAPSGADIMVLSEPPPADIEPPADVNALVDQALAAIEGLPAFTALFLDSQASKYRWSYDGAGTVRLEHYGNRKDTEPSESWIGRAGSQVRREFLPDGSEVWVEYTDQGDPRMEFVLGLGPCDTGWSYVGGATVAGREAFHVAGCGRELWLDRETLFVLRSDQGAVSGSPDPTRLDQRVVLEVAEFEVGAPPAEKFDVELMTGGATILPQAEAQCLQDPENCQPGQEPPPPIAALPDPPDAVAPGGVTTDPQAVLDLADGFAAAVPELMVATHEQYIDPGGGGSESTSRVWHDGRAGERRDFDWDLVDEANEPTVYLAIDGTMFESYATENGVVWYEWPPLEDGTPRTSWVGSRSTMQRCTDGWQHLGFATIVERTAHVLGCGEDRAWVDVETGMVMRSVVPSSILNPGTSIYEVTELEFGPQPDDRFQLPEGAVTTTEMP